MSTMGQSAPKEFTGPEPVSKQCITQGCQNYGALRNGGLCNACNSFRPQKPVIIGLEHYQAKIASALERHVASLPSVICRLTAEYTLPIRWLVTRPCVIRAIPSFVGKVIGELSQEDEVAELELYMTSLGRTEQLRQHNDTAETQGGVAASATPQAPQPTKVSTAPAFSQMMSLLGKPEQHERLWVQHEHGWTSVTCLKQLG